MRAAALALALLLASAAAWASDDARYCGPPARDADGTTNGRGVYAAMEVVTATTNGAAVTNISTYYT